MKERGKQSGGRWKNDPEFKKQMEQKVQISDMAKNFEDHVMRKKKEYTNGN